MTEGAGNVEAEVAGLRRSAAEIKEVGVMRVRSYSRASRHMRWVSYSFA
jgi:hypothetical protein